jgi:AcrR family transcriptional regulator
VILDAALKLFTEQGYVATSVSEIAAAAGVAPKTVYAASGTKRGVLMALRTRLVRGDDDPVPVAERDGDRRAVCPECLSSIPVGARRCAFCTAEQT